MLAYTFYKVASFFVKVIFGWGERHRFSSNHRHGQQKVPNSNVHIDRTPQRKTRKKRGFQGGEYVDFEEVK